jgi:hypothetical protein
VVKHIKLFEGYTDEELDSLRDDLHSIGSDERFELGKDFGIGGGFNKPNDGQYFPRISSKMFNFLLDKGEIEKGESRYDYYYFINQEKFGIPPNLPKIRITNNPRDNDYKIVIYYDKSKDNTLQKLKEYQNKNPKLTLYVNKNPVTPFRTHNIALARNFCLNFVRNNKEQFPYFIMMDFDDVNSKNLNLEPLKKNLERKDWDALSFNTSPKYYDIWGLSIYPYCFSYNHFNYNVQNYTIIQNYVTHLLNTLPSDSLQNCISAFNGNEPSACIKIILP